MKILVINGPNINMLGVREPGIYGNENYAALISNIEMWAKELDCQVECYQSNYEGDIVTKIQQAYGNFDGIVINPAAYTHTSIAILDALKSVAMPTVEVHISDVTQRESFRQISYAGMACEEHIIGKGLDGYRDALEYLCKKYK